MRTVTHVFQSELEAHWFEEGVEWVNDSSLEHDGEGPIDIEAPDEGYILTYLDQDHGNEDLTIDWRRQLL